MESLKAGDLSIDVAREAGTLGLSWKGKSTDRQPQRVLEPFFAIVLAEAERSKAALEMRFEQLQHFNSSTIGFLIQVIQDARARNVKLTLTYDGKLAWQRLSFDALRIFTKDNDLLELKASV
jgi:hypothetical protein